MMASSTNALSSCGGPNCNSHRNMKPFTAMIDSVAAGNRRDGILSRIGSTPGFLTVRYPKLKRNRRHTRLPHQNLGQPALLRVSSGLFMSMDDTNALIKQRKEKLDALRSKGIDPFKNKFTPDIGCGEAREKFERGKLAGSARVAIAGRITAHRDMGKSQFMDLKDMSGRIQIYAQKQTLGDEQFEIFKHLDLGDFIGVKGELFTTKAGEPSVKMTSFIILAKTLRPPPAKWHGLEDTEIRYRQRYLDLMANEEVKQVFLRRSEIIREIRNFLHSRGYVEVETPMMQAIPGGAAAQPFVTQHKALGCNFYMRIALELYLKRMLVGGIDRVFEIGRIFRNEGLSRKHNPEFTMLEAYQAYGDYETMMELVQSMICKVAEKVLGTLVIKHEVQIVGEKIVEAALEANKTLADVVETVAKQHAELHLREAEKVINLTPPWRRVKYKDLVREVGGRDWFDVTPQVRRRRAIEELKLAGDIAAGYEDF